MGYGFMIDFFLRLVEPLFPYVFDPLLLPLLNVGSPYTGALLTIGVVSVGLAGLLMLLRYWLMDLEKHEEFQERRKELSAQMKEAQNEGDVGDANEHMQEMMAMQKEFFQIQMKPMLVSMVLFFLFLPWMYTTFTPIVALDAVDNGTYEGELVYNGVTQPMMVQNDSEPVVIVDGDEYSVEETFMMEDLPWKVKDITFEDDTSSVKVAAEVVQLPVSLPLVGDELGWLGTYFIFVFPASIIFGKLLGVQ